MSLIMNIVSYNYKELFICLRCMHASAGYLMHSPLKASSIVRACCTLHNIAVEHGLPLLVRFKIYLKFLFIFILPVDNRIRERIIP